MQKAERVLAGAGILVAVGGGTMGAYLPTLYPDYARLGFWAGVGVLVVGVAMTLWAVSHRSPKQHAEGILVGDSYNNSGNNYGHMGPINIGKPAFELTPAHIQEVLGHLIGGRPVVVQAVGNQRAWAMGAAMVQAIGAAGYTVVQENIGMMIPAPEGPLTVSHQGNTTCITIAPSA